MPLKKLRKFSRSGPLLLTSALILTSGYVQVAYAEEVPAVPNNDASKANSKNEKNAETLPEVAVTASEETDGNLSKPYAGGQVATGGGLGILGVKSIMDTPFNQTN